MPVSLTENFSTSDVAWPACTVRLNADDHLALAR